MKVDDLHAIVEAIRKPLKEELAQEIEGRIERFRQAVYVRDEWCCNDLTLFAMDCWGAAKPRTSETFGTVAYQLRGRSVNYCPFCGVSFLAPKAAKS